MTDYAKIEAAVSAQALACGRQPQDVKVIAVSKNFGSDDLMDVYQQGGREFGESRVQESLKKIPLLPTDCQWHLIGHLQSNKVAKAVATFQLIHSVDNPLLAQKISYISQMQGIQTSILLQVNVSGEKTKQGLSPEEWFKALDFMHSLSHVRIEGLMTIAPDTNEQAIIRSCFRQLYQLREAWKNQMPNPAIFQHLSMGMSHDYLIAIEEGATLLRIGSAIFGNRVR